jgi:hypothetical protein
MARSKRRAVYFVLLAVISAELVLILPSCSSPPPVVSKAVCPPIIEYTGAQEHQAGTELVRYLPPNSEIEKMLSDYRAERDMLRACRAS